MISFIEDLRSRWGVEPICKYLPIAPSTYYAARHANGSPRAERDEFLKGQITRVYEQNYRIYGADKIWAQLNREEIMFKGEKIKVARCTVERLMHELGIRGAVRGKKHRITIPGDQANRPADLVERTFKAPAPNRSWVADDRGNQKLQSLEGPRRRVRHLGVGRVVEPPAAAGTDRHDPSG